MLTKEIADEFFDYKDGVLYRKKQTSSNAKIGDVAGTTRQDGYRHINLHGKFYLVHRLIFLMHHGFLPKVIDHIDGNSLNNRIENLRVATKSQNCQNARIRRNNTSGIKNVHFNKQSNKWQVSISINQKWKHVGYYQDLELAELVATEARDKYHGGFARHI
jgi:hypothetical protein